MSGRVSGIHPLAEEEGSDQCGDWDVIGVINLPHLHILHIKYLVNSYVFGDASQILCSIFSLVCFPEEKFL